jgi:hypothetical protein
VAGQERLERLRNLLRVETDRPRPLLVDDEADGRGHLVPVEMRVDHVGVRPHRLANPPRDLAHGHRLGANHAELDGEADRRAEVEAVDPHPSLAQGAGGDGSLHARLDSLPGVRVLCHDDNLGEGFVRELRVEAQPEPRRALADVGGVGGDVRIVAEEPLSAFRAVSAVTPIAVPSGRRIWKNSSGRSDRGKNCCCTLPKAAIAATKIATVASTVASRNFTQARITARRPR